MRPGSPVNVALEALPLVLYGRRSHVNRTYQVPTGKQSGGCAWGVTGRRERGRFRGPTPAATPAGREAAPCGAHGNDALGLTGGSPSGAGMSTAGTRGRAGAGTGQGVGCRRCPAPRMEPRPLGKPHASATAYGRSSGPAEAGWKLRLCRFRAGADSRHLTPQPPSRRLFEPLVLRQTAGGDGRRGENGSTSTIPDAGMAKCGPSVLMHDVSGKPAPQTEDPVTSAEPYGPHAGSKDTPSLVSLRRSLPSVRIV